MSNSSLVSYTQISPNKNSPRNNKIKKITIHHMAGNLSVETCGRVFASTARQASSNYGIGSDGRIGLYVDEKDRSWCSSNATNDNQAITIEVANDGGAPDWHVSDKAMAALIDLCVDICKRNGIDRLNFTGDASGNLTQHNYFAATACPGPYLKSKFRYIADQVNARLSNDTPSVPSGDLYRVQAGAFKDKKNAENLSAKVSAAGFQNYIVKQDDFYKVQIGAFSKKENAQKQLASLKAAGFEAFISGGSSSTGETPTPPPTPSKSIDELAKEVIAGKWGNGAERKARLTAAGYDYNAVQARVNELIGSTNRKSIDTIAREVIAGVWGNGTDRKARLTAAGYDYNAVQARVNELL